MFVDSFFERKYYLSSIGVKSQYNGSYLKYSRQRIFDLIAQYQINEIKIKIMAVHYFYLFPDRPDFPDICWCVRWSQ